MSLLDAAGHPLSPTPVQLSLPTGVERPRTRILIGVPARDEVKTGFMIDVVSLVGSTLKNRPELDLAVMVERGMSVPAQRTTLVAKALQAEADYILWVDSDMRFPKTALVRLLAHGVPVVAANYVTRAVPPVPVSHLDDRDDTKRLYTTEGSHGLEEVAATGMGMMLTSMDVFKHTPAPWFGFHWVPEKLAYTTEDVWFCRSIREHGYKVFVDHDLSQEIAHLGEFPFENMHARPEE